MQRKADAGQQPPSSTAICTTSDQTTARIPPSRPYSTVMPPVSATLQASGRPVQTSTTTAAAYSATAVAAARDTRNTADSANRVARSKRSSRYS